MKEEIFKVGDKVYNHHYGWGEIKERYDRYLMVDFDNHKSRFIPFTFDGRECLRYGNPSLSFTEYTLKGFSQERPIVLPEVGELCLFSVTNTCPKTLMDDKEDWVLREFINYIPEYEFPYITQNHVPFKKIKRIKILN